MPKIWGTLSPENWIPKTTYFRRFDDFVSEWQLIMANIVGTKHGSRAVNGSAVMGQMGQQSEWVTWVTGQYRKTLDPSLGEV